MVNVDEERTVVESSELEFTCAACGHTGLTDAFQFKTVDKLYGLITVWVTHETSLMCPACDATYRSSESPLRLASLPPTHVSNHFRLRIGLVEKFLVVAAWLLICSGPVSLVMFLVSLCMLPAQATGWRLAAKIGGFVTAGLLLIVVMAMILG